MSSNVVLNASGDVSSLAGDKLPVGEQSYRMLPHNLEAEQGLLGALLVDNRVAEKVSDFLNDIHFFMPAKKY